MRHRMSDYQRLTKKLMDELRIKQSGLAARLGVSQGTVSRWLNGHTVEVENREKLDRLASEVFKTPRRRASDVGIPIMGFASAGDDNVSFGNGQGPFGYAKAPENASDRTVAIQIKGTSLGVFFDGWLAYYDDRHDPPTGALAGRVCVVGLPDDRVLIKKLVKADAPKRWHLLSNMGNMPILDVDVIWAAPVIDIRPPEDILS